MMAKLRHQNTQSIALPDGIRQITAPPSLNILNRETISFLNEIRAMSAGVGESQAFNINLSCVTKVDLSAGLALTAELDRWQRQRKRFLVPATVAGWDPAVREHLTALGFFKILKTPLYENQPGGVTNNWIQFISGEKTIGAAASLLRRKLERVFGGPTGINMEIYGSLVEAMKNTFQHAYPVDDLILPAEDNKERRWWMVTAHPPVSWVKRVA